MDKKWIGEEDNTSGTYYATSCKELQKRTGGSYNAKKLYKFNSRFGSEYHITDEDAVNKIEEFLTTEESTGLYEYLYNLVIEKFGVIEFIVGIGHKIAKERDEGYKKGKERLQQEVRQLLGM
jgi:hypothetical protein